ncbi:MAG TPA: hypothetical protein VGN86_16060 [Pyrinomonadaceae bacterium]|jgi:Mn2+/Fe2+ NRAMP family transporter|nr:hypothetical protein [Pyrinomonadaceae bacterium]
MKRFHLIFGILIVIVFLLTGQYMDKYLNHLHGWPDGPRMLYRTRHIFILFSGLIHLVLGAYVVKRMLRWQRILQWVGSAFLVAASVLFIAAFFYDSIRGDLSAPLSYRGVFLAAYGVLAHLLSSIRRKNSTV